MDTAWAWVTEGRYPGFCRTFVRDRDPATVAERLGGGPPAVMTVEQTGDAYPPHQRGSLLRAYQVIFAAAGLAAAASLVIALFIPRRAAVTRRATAAEPELAAAAR
ncbi:hypothetical protein [Actinoplanes sp. RD1]|uniref:hypothetical protein n=1 Tax=Actinoplanes sp. RD1 TaxID=3064538 RepID=UPI0027424FC2|nr:hypothetical protein [Actinoplanes sp. RD1]